jgi:histidinol phosphatase-like PHP family hydrolase
MSQAICNLHNHTPFSDGAYSIDELCEAHLALEDIEIEGIGVCDHLFCTPTSREITDERDFERIFSAEMRRYVEYVQAARERWAGKLRVYCGCGIDWNLNKAMLPQIRAMLAGVDYVLFERLDWAALTQLANQSRRWPCAVGVARMNVASDLPSTSMDQVVRTLANARIFFEFSSEFLPLPEDDRWYNLLPQHRVMVSIGTDTHDDLSVINRLGEQHAYALRRGLGERLFRPRTVELVAAGLTG